MKLQKNDFIELEFAGRIKDGDIFDSNMKEKVKEINPDADLSKIKSFVFPLGNSMFLQGVDEFLIGKDIGKYEVEISPEKAFGKRDPKLVQMIPIKIFQEHKINPIPGATFNFDGKLAKVLTVSLPIVVEPLRRLNSLF